MRERKYRAYNTKLRKMAQVIAIECDPEFGGVFVWGKDHVDHETLGHDADRDFWSWDDCATMEFTEYTDKKSVDIYEGDIVKVGTLGTHYHVRWEKFTDSLDYLRGETWMIAHETLYMNKENCEVIGNVWENPELIKKKP